MTQALTFEGLTVAAVGMVGDELRFACAVPIVVVPGSVYRLVVVVTVGQHCYRVPVRCTGYDRQGLYLQLRWIADWQTLSVVGLSIASG